MSLLNKASLVVTPNAYKESKLYSVIPSDGSGDMDVVRATTATRVNSAGLIEVVPRNLLTYSNDFTNVIWVKNSCTISANSIISPDGTTNASKLVEGTANDSHHIYQNVLSNGQNTFTFYAKAGERKFVYAYADNVAQGKCFDLENGILGVNIIAAPLNSTITSVGNGWYRCSITISMTSTALRIGVCSANGTFSYLGNGTSGIYIYGAQLDQNSTATEYFPTTTRLNIPRIDYTNGSCPSLLVEPQSTNLCTFSNDFSNVLYNYQNASYYATPIVSPDGTSNGYGILANTSTNLPHRWYKTFVGLTGIKTTTIYANKGTSKYLGIGFNSNGSTGNNNIVVYNLENGTIATNPNSINATITSVGNGWYRCQHTFDFGTGGTTADLCVHNAGVYNTYVTSSFQVSDFPTATTILYIYGVQVESVAYPTSYIPTVASSVTRNLEIISNNNLISKGLIVNDYVIFIDVTNPNIGGNQYMLDPFDISSNRTGIIRIDGTTAVLSDVAGGTSLNMTNSILLGKNKLCVKRTGSTLSLFTNGVKFASTTTTTAGTINNLITGVGNSNVSSYINSIVLFPTALTDAECIALTTL